MGFLLAVTPPTDGVRLQEKEVSIFVEREDFGKGILYIAESQVSWINSSGQGCIIPYQAISLHAVSRDLTAFPHQCLYLMIDGKLMSEVQEVQRQQGPAGDQTEGTEEQEEAFEAVREIRFVPAKNEDLVAMFDAMTSCQELHPDPEDEDSGEEYDDADEGEEEEEDQETINTNQGIVLVPSLNGSHSTTGQKDESMDTGQFDDADMEPDH